MEGWTAPVDAPEYAMEGRNDDHLAIPMDLGPDLNMALSPSFMFSVGINDSPRLTGSHPNLLASPILNPRTPPLGSPLVPSPFQTITDAPFGLDLSPGYFNRLFSPIPSPSRQEISHRFPSWTGFQHIAFSLPSTQLLDRFQAQWNLFAVSERCEQSTLELSKSLGSDSDAVLRTGENFIATNQLSTLYGDLSLSGLSSRSANVVQSLMVALMNNFGSVSSSNGHSLPSDFVLKLLKTQRELLPLLSRSLESLPIYRARDLAAKLIYASIQAGDEKVLKRLLDLNLVPVDYDFWRSNCPSKTAPFELAVKEMKVPIVKVLKEAGVHRVLLDGGVHRWTGVTQYDLSCIMEDWEFENLSKRRKEGLDQKVQFTKTELNAMTSIVDLLSDLDIKVSPKAFWDAAEYGGTELVVPFISIIIGKYHELLFRPREKPYNDPNVRCIAAFLAAKYPEELVVDYLERFMSVCSAEECNQCLGRHQSSVDSVIFDVGERLWTMAIRVFAKRKVGGAKTWNQVLSIAIQEGNEAIVDDILQYMPEIGMANPVSGGNKYRRDTIEDIPVVAAMRKGNHALVRHFQSAYNAESAPMMLEAAAECGSTEAVKDILHRFPHIAHPSMCCAASNAILYGYDETFWELQKAGADIACVEGHEMKSPLHMAVFKKDKTKFYTIVNSGLELNSLNLIVKKAGGAINSSLIEDAILWGERDVIKTLHHFQSTYLSKYLSDELKLLPSVGSALSENRDGIFDFIIDLQILPSKVLVWILAFAFSSENESLAIKLVDIGADIYDYDVLEQAILQPRILEVCLRKAVGIPRTYLNDNHNLVERAIELGSEGAEAAGLLFEFDVIEVTTHLCIDSRFGVDLLKFAAKINPRVLEILLKELRGQPVLHRSLGVGALEHAINAGDQRSTELLIECGIVDLSEEVLWEAAAENGNLQVLSTLIEKTRAHEIRKHGFGTRALSLAIESELDQHRESVTGGAVDLLLDSGLIKISAAEPLKAAIDSYQPGEIGMIRKLLNYGFRPSNIIHGKRYSPMTSRTAFCHSIAKGDLRLVELMITHMTDQNAEVNAEAKLGHTRTPLQQAAESSKLDIVKLLLEKHGADVNAKPAYRAGATAFQLAAIEGRCDITQVLLEHGADMHAEPAKIHGRRPLEGAAEWGRLDMIHYLDQIGYRFERAECERALEYAKKGIHIGCEGLLQEIMNRKDVFGTQSRITEAMATAAQFA